MKTLDTFKTAVKTHFSNLTLNRFSVVFFIVFNTFYFIMFLIVSHALVTFNINLITIL